MKAARFLSLLLALALLVCPAVPALAEGPAVVATVGETGYTDLREAFDAALGSGANDVPVVRLDNDLPLTEQFPVTGSVVLDLNGHIIYNTVDIYDYGSGSLSLVSVRNGASLTIIDSRGGGGLLARPYDCYALDARYGGSVVIMGGTYAGNAIDIYADGGAVSIHDGYFYIQQEGNGSYAHTLYRTARAGSRMTVMGGTYLRYNPASSGYVPYGYASVYNQYNQTWTVTPARSVGGPARTAATYDADGEGLSFYASLEDAAANVSEGGTLQLLNDFTAEELSLSNGLSFRLDLNGCTMNVARLSVLSADGEPTHVTVASGGGHLLGDSVRAGEGCSFTVEDEDIRILCGFEGDGVRLRAGLYGSDPTAFTDEGCAAVRLDDGSWRITHDSADADSDGLCDVCGAPISDDLDYQPPVGTIIGVAFENIGYEWIYHAYVGDGETNYSGSIHTDYEAAMDYGHVRVDYPITVDNRTGQDLMSGTVDEDKALIVVLNTADGNSYSTVKPPHPASDTDPTPINEIRTLMWEGLLSIESDNGMPDAGDATLSLSIGDQSMLMHMVSFATYAECSVWPQFVFHGARVRPPESPVWSGAVFAGWYEDAAYTKPFDFDTPIMKHIILHAKWEVPDLVLPAELTRIGDEAFRGGAFRFARLAENTESVGRLAFADCPKLRYVCIPESVVSIDPQAFGSLEGLTLLGAAGSLAERYAEQHGFAFVSMK